MRQLRDKDIQKLASETGIQLADLQTLYALGVLDPINAINVLVRKDYRDLKAKQRYTVANIIVALMEEYGLSKTLVRDAINYKTHKVGGIYCNDCGAKISKRTSDNNGGICNRCAIRSMKL